MTLLQITKCRRGDETREERVAHPVAHEARQCGGEIGESRSGEKHLSRLVADVGDCRSHETKYDERYQETEELAEDGIKRGEESSESYREELSRDYAEDNRDDDFYKKVDFRKFHNIRHELFYNRLLPTYAGSVLADKPAIIRS